MAHICVSKLTIIGSDNGLLAVWRQVIIWTNAGILSIGPLRTNFTEILIPIHIFSSKKTHRNVSSAKCRPFCLSLNVLNCRCIKSYSIHVFVPFQLTTGKAVQTYYHQISNISRTKSQNVTSLQLSLCDIHMYWGQVLSLEWRCTVLSLI